MGLTDEPRSWEYTFGKRGKSSPPWQSKSGGKMVVRVQIEDSKGDSFFYNVGTEEWITSPLRALLVFTLPFLSQQWGI